MIQGKGGYRNSISYSRWKVSTFSRNLTAGEPTTGSCLHHILLVDDHSGVLNAMRELLTSNGYRVTTAASLREAVERARENSDLDLLITDYHLGGRETGRQVVGHVREMRGPQFKAVVITGDTAAAVHGFDGDGALCWVSKPINPKQLLTVLKNLLP
jgi:CheY-like chemotaxis protein